MFPHQGSSTKLFSATVFSPGPDQIGHLKSENISWGLDGNVILPRVLLTLRQCDWGFQDIARLHFREGAQVHHLNERGNRIHGTLSEFNGFHWLNQENRWWFMWDKWGLTLMSSSWVSWSMTRLSVGICWRCGGYLHSCVYIYIYK